MRKFFTLFFITYLTILCAGPILMAGTVRWLWGKMNKEKFGLNHLFDMLASTILLLTLFAWLGWKMMKGK